VVLPRATSFVEVAAPSSYSVLAENNALAHGLRHDVARRLNATYIVGKKRKNTAAN